MKKIFYTIAFLIALVTIPLSISAQCPGATRTVVDCKAGTINAIGWAMKNFFQDGSTSTWNWEAGAKFVENTDGTADLTGVISHLGNPTTRRFQVNIHLIGQTYTAPLGSPVLFNTSPSIVGWYYYDWGESTLTGLNDLSGAKLILLKRGKSLQVGTGAADQVEEIGKNGASGWFSWQIISQPSNNWLRINTFPTNPSVDEADICIALSGYPTNCNNTCDNDATPPTITNCPTNIKLTTTTYCAIANWTAPTTNDNCSTPSVSLTSSPTAGLGIGSCFPVGTTTLTYKATDAKGNSATCYFTVTVTKQDNNLDCNNVTVSAGNGTIAIGGLTAPHVNIQVYKVYDYGGWLSVFECVDGQCSKPIQNISNLEAANYKIFVTFFNDKWENVCTISKDIKVTTGGTNPCDNDVTNPTFTNCPSNISVTTTADCETATWTAPTAADNCTTPSVSITSAPTVGLTSGSCFPIGTTTITYKATDAKGNMATCTFTVTVVKTNPCDNDVTPPIFTNCPANIYLTTTLHGCVIASWTAPTATDNCTTPSVSVTSAPTAGLTSGSCFPIGTTTITYKATDAKGNMATCTFTVTVVKTDPCDGDLEPPIISGCPANIYLTTTLACATASWDTPYASDNCSSPSLFLMSSPTPRLGSGSCFPIGTTTLTYRAVDDKGNTSTCSFTVKVVKVNACDNITYAGTIGKTCVNGKITLTNITSPSGGSGVIEYLWLKSTVGCPPNAPNQVVPNSNSPTLTVNHITQKTYYLRCVRRVGCTKDSEFIESNCIVVYPNSCAYSYNHLASKTILTMEANAEYNRSLIQWVNNTGYKNDFFAVQKMNAATGLFEDLEIINAIKQNDELQDFSSYDNSPTEGDNSYRIKLVYDDGKVDYSEIKVVIFKGLSGIRIFPNPSNDYTNLDLTKYKNKPVSIYLYNAFGQPVQVLHIEKVGEEPVRLDVSTYNSGHFLIRITSKGKRDVTQQLIITR